MCEQDPVHSGHLLLDISNSNSYCQEERRGFIRVSAVTQSGIGLLAGGEFNHFPTRSNPCRELAWFLTTGIVVSAFALPIVLARAPVAVSASFLSSICIKGCIIYDNLGDSSPHPPKQHNNHRDSSRQHNTRPLRAIHYCGTFCFSEFMNYCRFPTF